MKSGSGIPAVARKPGEHLLLLTKIAGIQASIPHSFQRSAAAAAISARAP